MRLLLHCAGASPLSGAAFTGLGVSHHAEWHIVHWRGPYLSTRIPTHAHTAVRSHWGCGSYEFMPTRVFENN